MYNYEIRSTAWLNVGARFSIGLASECEGCELNIWRNSLRALKTRITLSIVILFNKSINCGFISNIYTDQLKFIKELRNLLIISIGAYEFNDGYN